MSRSAAEVIAAMKAKAAQQPTRTLCEALTVLDGRNLDEAERLTRSVLIDVLCERHPQADAAFDAWASEEPAYMASTAVEAITRAALAAA
jgi:hypothetical protein